MQNRSYHPARRRTGIPSTLAKVSTLRRGLPVLGAVGVAIGGAAPFAMAANATTTAGRCLLGSLLCNAPVSSPAGSTPAYWLAGSEGGVGAYGGTPFQGSMSSHPLARPVTGMAATADGKGYWLVASDGGIFAFGDAGYYGSMGGHHLARSVVGVAATPDGKGYWLVASDGGIFAFGDAHFYGSMGGQPLAAPVVGITATPGGDGYWLVASDGGIFAFGDAPFHGSMGGRPLKAPMVGMAATPDGGGYWTVAADGGIFSFGNAPFRGSASGYVPNGEWITTMAEGPGSGSGSSEQGDFSTKQVAAGPPYAAGQSGYDISWPQCGGSFPPQAPVAVVGVNGGSAFTANPCFNSEASWGGSALTMYLNLNSPQGSSAGQGAQGPAGNCASGDLNCESYNYGYNAAANSIATAHSAGFTTGTWWLDVETGNYWTSDTAANDQVVAGALAAVRTAGYSSALYSTAYQWSQIAGSYDPSVPVWYPTGQATSSPNSYCASSSFAGGPVYLVQSAAGGYDGDYSC